MQSPISNFNNILIGKRLHGFIVTNPVNIFYLTGFKGVSPTEREAILTFNPKPTLITSRLYQIEANKLKSSNLLINIINSRSQMLNEIKKLLNKCKNIGFESYDLKFVEYKKYKNLLKSSKLIPTKQLIEDLRIVKNSSQLQYIQKAQEISQKAFYELINTIKIGQTESEIAEKLTSILKSQGSQGIAFEPIVASGINSALPHYITGNKKIKTGEVLLLDFGAKYKNYCADLSRTIFIGNAHDEQKNIYNIVQNVQDSVITKIKNNLKAKDAFNVANNIFKKQKLENNFTHSLGHGIGLDVHELPSLSKKSKDKLKSGMVFSVEPGLYFPKWGGVRIEDLITIKNGSAKILGRHSTFIEIK